ncbi:hypothetical protein AB6A40_002554 [Gnathostoma spinigerum]|uniref:Alpha-1,3-mannosyl-glycoprotein 2-beta-N-acetylglucosaminyltransferase n=1 Tax=Gnathostoma spinigerum TaxID=75299 RepID=A0ABD6E6W8_9BILA
MTDNVESEFNEETRFVHTALLEQITTDHSDALIDTFFSFPLSSTMSISRIFTRFRRKICVTHAARQCFWLVLAVILFLLFHEQIIFIFSSNPSEETAANVQDELRRGKDYTLFRPIIREPSARKRTKHYFNNARSSNNISKTVDPNSRTAVLVMAANRAAAITNHLQQLIRLRPSIEEFPIVVSQDGAVSDVTDAIVPFINEKNRTYHLRHIDREKPIVSKAQLNYYFIAQHYKWALDIVFFQMNFTRVIITEDDLDIAQDFFSYFTATRHLLDEDPTIWCISAWNDNGGSNLTDQKRSSQLFRTDFFPGLGWMLKDDLWRELTVKWPQAYWDDWMREQATRKDRVCIRPEISRTSHNNDLAGKGSSGGLYKKYLASIHLPTEPIDFLQLDLSYLKKKDYDRLLLTELREAKPISLNDLTKGNIYPPNSINIFVYHTPREFRALGKATGLMLDIRSGMPRTAYYGIVSFRANGCQIHAISNATSLKENFFDQPSSHFYSDRWSQMTTYLEFRETYCTPKRFTGVCDPTNPEMLAWLKQKNLLKRLAGWGKMIVN